VPGVSRHVSRTSSTVGWQEGPGGRLEEKAGSFAFGLFRAVYTMRDEGNGYGSCELSHLSSMASIRSFVCVAQDFLSAFGLVLSRE
jgi:hypothetical protein